MSQKHTIIPGLVREETYEVTLEHSAQHLGSGNLWVLATPSMILFIERTARKLLEDHLPPGLSSVGAHLDVRHLAPTPVGSRVVAHVEVVAVEGNRIKFNVQAHDPHEQVGVGSHIRYVIDEAQFLRRVEEKA